jgi:hypothetical protein
MAERQQLQVQKKREQENARRRQLASTDERSSWIFGEQATEGLLLATRGYETTQSSALACKARERCCCHVVLDL